MFINVYFLTGAKLVLFGSSKNGFGFKQSDLDICMTLEGQDTAEVPFLISTIMQGLYDAQTERVYYSYYRV